MGCKTYQESFADFVKRLEFDEINLLIYISKLAIFQGSRNITVSYLDVSYHLGLKGKGTDYVKNNIPQLLSLYFEKDGQYFPFFEKVHLRNNHFEFVLTQMFEEASFHFFVKVISLLSPNVIYNVNKHHTIYLYLKLKEEFFRRETMFECSLMMTTEELKAVFGLSGYDYHDVDGFNRCKFEKNFLISSIEDINGLDKSLSLEWEKVKENRLVTGYLIKCSILKA